MAVLLIAAFAPGQGGAPRTRLPGIQQAPTPDWVIDLPFDPSTQVPQDRLSGGTHELLVDLQIRAGDEPEQHHYHLARRVLNTQGVDDASQVAVSFDPSCEEIELHEILVHRDGEVLPRLDLSLARVVEPEGRRDQQIFDGRQTLLLFLPDVRVGDVVETRYTVRGANPVFAGRFAAAFYTAQVYPIQQLRCRVLVPADMPMQWKHHNGELEAVVRDLDGWREFIWQEDQVAPVYVEDGLPAWYDPMPWIQVTEYRTWQEVERWADDLFQLPPRMPKSVADLVRRIQAQSDSKSEQALAALRFVQDEVRYLGLQFGIGSFQPSPITEVLARRYGDCKGKTMLTLALLKGLGIRAQAALVHTALGARVRELLPTHHAFDHVIVRAEIGGKVLWLDPTLSQQRGALEDQAAPDLGVALVLGAKGNVCQVIPRSADQITRVRVVRTLDVRSGVDPVPFTVETVYQGSDADMVRRELRRSNAHEMQRMYLSFYASAWPSILPTGDLLVEDDTERNEVRIVESYAIPGFWKQAERTQEQGDVPALEISMLVPGAVAEVRSMPLSLPSTAMDSTTLLRMDDGWSVETEEARVDNEFLRAGFTSQYEHGWLELHHTIVPLADHIPAQACAASLRELDPFRESLQYQLLRRRRGEGFTEEVADR